MSAALGSGLTIAAYLAARALNRRYPSPMTTVALVATVLVGATLLLAHASLRDYAPARDALSSLLSPATAALALPLYRNRRLLGENIGAALAGLLVGATTTVCAALTGAAVLRLPYDVTAALAIKSVTAAVAAELAASLHTDPSLVVVVVIATGIFGAACGPWLLDRARVHDPIARGVAIGTICHGIGTARIAAEDPFSGAAAGSAMCGMAAALSIVAALVVR